MMRWLTEWKAHFRRVQLERAGQAEFGEGRMEQAAQHARALYALDADNSWSNRFLAFYYFEHEEYAAALPCLDWVAREWPQDALAQYALGVCRHQTDHLPEAIAAYRQALALRPHWTEIYKHIGQAYYLCGEFADAEQALRTYCQAQSLIDDAEQGDTTETKEAHDLLGYLCYRQGKLLASAAHYERAYQLDPLNPSLARNARLLYTRSARS